MFLIENERKTSYRCLKFVFYQKYFLWLNGLKTFLFSFDKIYNYSQNI